MSQSGIPVVSQVAQVASTIGSSVGDIFSGKNVFEALGRIVASPIAAAGDLANDISFNSLANQPIGKDFFAGSRAFVENPYSRDAASQLAKGTAQVGATVAGGLLLAPVAGAQLGIGSTASTILGAGIGNKIGNGDFLGALSAVAPSLSDALPDDLKNLYNQYGGTVASLLPSASPQSVSPSYGDRTFSSPAQTIKEGFGTTETLLLLASAGLVFYLAVKK